jgi:hypothetical protein
MDGVLGSYDFTNTYIIRYTLLAYFIEKNDPSTNRSCKLETNKWFKTKMENTKTL